MQVNMKDFLTCHFTIGQEEVHSFTLQSTAPQSLGDSLSDTKHLRAGVFI
jgi:hypothetical protein